MIFSSNLMILENVPDILKNLRRLNPECRDKFLVYTTKLPGTCIILKFVRDIITIKFLKSGIRRGQS